MAKFKKAKKNRRNKRQGGYVPLLARHMQMQQREAWEEQMPRLAPNQIERLGEILRQADTRRREIDRFSWRAYHEELEKEVADKVFTDPILKGLRIAIEWRLHFFKEKYQQMLLQDPDLQPYLDGMLPDSSFTATTLFDAVEIFQPRVVLLQWESQGTFLESAEESIHYSLKRQKEGDAYFSDVQRIMTTVPGEGGDMDPNRPAQNLEGE